MFLPPEIASLLDQVLPSSWTLPAGILLAAFGERVYRLLVLAPGLLLGMWIGAQAGPLLGLTPILSAALAAVLAFLGALACQRAENLAVRAMGALAGVLAGAWGWQMVTQALAPWWAAVVAGILGLLIAPYLQVWLMRGLTAFAGGLCIASFAGRAHDPLVVGAVTVLGIGFQSWMAGGSSTPAKKAPKKKK